MTTGELNKGCVDLGVSQNGLSLSRSLDRLPDGTWVITLSKGPGLWLVDIDRSEPLRKGWQLDEDASQLLRDYPGPRDDE